MKITTWILFAIVAFPVIILVGLYVFVFHNQNISLDGEKWAAFSTYFQLPALIANTVVVAYISLLVYKSGIDRDKSITDRGEFEAKFLKASEKPIIIFCEKRDEIYAVNVGRGAALNIMFITSTDGKNFINEPGKYYSIASKGEICIDWLTNKNLLQCLYEDIFSMDNKRQELLFTTYDQVTNSFRTLKSKDYDTYDNNLKTLINNYKAYDERLPFMEVDKWPFQA